MPAGTTNSRTYRFGRFVFDARAGELIRDRRRVRLPGQAAALLEALVGSPGQVLTRDELRARLWPHGTYVDFDHGLANAVQRLRDALGDSATQPTYVETLPRRGFRFLAAVECVPPAVAEPASPVTRLRMPGRRATWLAAALALASLAVMALLLLREPTPVAASDPISGSPPRLVVLPFANLTGDAADDYIVDGLTDELITRLGQIAPDRLAVVARTSAMRYRGGADLARVALELDVDYALEGSVRREGDRIRVSARLVRVADGAQQWTGVFGRERHRALDVQADVARLVAAALPLHLPASPRAWLTRDGTSHPAAREAYLRGKWFANQTTPEGMRRSIEQLNRAIVIDPQYARAHAALAASLHFGGAVGVIDQAEARRLTHEAAGRALELDPTAGDALAVLAESRFRFGGETKGVEQMFRRAAALRPQDPDVLHWLGMFLALTGDAGEALATLERARQIDPLALHLGADYAAVLHLAGRREEAARELERVRELDPLFPKTYLVEASIALDEESHTDAIAALRRANELSPGTPKYVASLARAYAAAGRTNDARRTLAELRTLAGSVHVAPELIRVVERELVAAP